MEGDVAWTHEIFPTFRLYVIFMLSNSLDKKFLLKNNHRTWIIGST